MGQWRGFAGASNTNMRNFDVGVADSLTGVVVVTVTVVEKIKRSRCKEVDVNKSKRNVKGLFSNPIIQTIKIVAFDCSVTEPVTNVTYCDLLSSSRPRVISGFSL
jgi:hypothetical protein